MVGIKKAAPPPQPAPPPFPGKGKGAGGPVFPAPVPVPLNPPGGGVDAVGLPGAAGFNALLGDGSVRYFPATTRPETLRIWIGADDGQVNPPD